MNEFDDEQLRDELGRRAGPGVSVAAAHEAVLDRAGLVRRRRVAVAGSGALIALVVGGLVLLPGVDGGPQAPAGTGQPIPSVDDELVSDALPTSTAAADPDRSEIADGADSTATTGSSVRPTTTTLPGAAEPSSNTSPPTTSASTTPALTTPASSTTASSTTSASNEPAATTTVGQSSSSSSTSSIQEPMLAPFTRSFDSAGGSITVDWDGASFSLLSVSPAAGFEAEIEDQRATRIRVRFRGDDDDSRIEVRVEQGQLSVDIS